MFPFYIPSSKVFSGKSPVNSELGWLSCLLEEMLALELSSLGLYSYGFVFSSFLPKNDNCMVIDDLRVP